MKCNGVRSIRGMKKLPRRTGGAAHGISELGAALGAEIGGSALGLVAAVGALGDWLGSAAAETETAGIGDAAGTDPRIDIGDVVVDGVLLREGARGDGEGEVGAAIESTGIN